MSSSFLNQLIYGGTAEDEDDDDGGNTLFLEEERHGFDASSALDPGFSTGKYDEDTTKKEEPEEHDLLNDPVILDELPAVDPVVDTVEAVTSSLDALYAPSFSIGHFDNPAGVFKNPLLLDLPAPTKENHGRNEENQKELELHELRNKRKLEWGYARKRWKRRRINLTEEQDVGNAIARQTRNVWSARKRQAKAENQPQSPVLSANLHSTNLARQKRKRAPSSSSPGGHNKLDDGESILDSSDEEQEQILQRLTQSQPEEESSEKGTVAMDSKEALAARKLEEKLERARISQLEDMDYWELGNIAPRNNKIYVLPPMETFVSRGIDVMMQGPPHDGPKRGGVILASSYARVPREAIPDPNTFLYFPLSHSVQVDKEFLHCRQLVRLAKRFIVGTAGQMRLSRHEDRLLKTVWETREQNRRLTFLLTQTQQLGINMKVFLSHRWKDDSSRALVAKKLGAIDTRDYNDLLGPSQMIGRTLAPQDFRRFHLFERRRLIDLYSIGVKVADRSDGGVAGGTEAGKQHCIRPSVGYVHVSDTIPPVPSHPLDETGLLFGPRDKHTAFRHIGPVDEATYNLNLSSLLTRISSILADTNADELVQNLQEQLRVLVEHSPSATRKMIHKLVLCRKKTPISELPLVQYYRTIIFYCSFAASGCPQPVKEEVIELGGDDNDDDPYEIEQSHADGIYKTEVLPMDTTAKKIYGFCEDHLGHVGLQAFPRLHLTYGLVCIARILPPSAAEIVSRPLDDWKSRTPFDIFRCLLEHMEDESMLIGSDDHDGDPGFASSSSVVQVAELEYTLHQAASIFARCIERDPVEVNNHAWYLGALASSLLLCSGNRIGSKALPFPSSHYNVHNDDGSEDLFAGIDDDVSTADSPRATLPKFAEVRRNVQKALRLCLHLSHRQEGSTRGHLIISSFLEWKQVIALLAGSSCQKEGRLEELRDFHHRQATHWAISDKSKRAMEYLRRLNLNGAETVLSDTKIRQWTAAIEDDPDNVGYWRKLVEALGPIGVLKPREGSRRCTGCSECNVLHEGLMIDHSDLEARKRSGLWWGRNLVSWWYPHFLGLSCRKLHLGAPTSEMERVVRVLRENLPHDLEMQQERVNNRAQSCDPEWLFDDTDEIEMQRKSVTCPVPDDAFPKSFVELLEHGPEAEPLDHTPFLDSEAPPSEAEVLYLKLAVTCHLLGVAHPGLYGGVYEIARNSVDDHFRLNDNDYWLYLQKLSRMGLNIPRFLQQLESPRRIIKHFDLSQAQSTE